MNERSGINPASAGITPVARGTSAPTLGLLRTVIDGGFRQSGGRMGGGEGEG